MIGQIGFHPGSEWGTGDTSTANNALRRKDNICQGDADGSDAFDPATQWQGFPQDMFDGLDSHSVTCESATGLFISEYVCPSNPKNRIPG